MNFASDYGSLIVSRPLGPYARSPRTTANQSSNSATEHLFLARLQPRCVIEVFALLYAESWLLIRSGRALQQEVARFGHQWPITSEAASLLLVPLLAKHDVKICFITGSDRIHARGFRAAARNSIHNPTHHATNFGTDFLAQVQQHSLCHKLAGSCWSRKRNWHDTDPQNRLNAQLVYLDHIAPINDLAKKAVALWDHIVGGWETFNVEDAKRRKRPKSTSSEVFLCPLPTLCWNAFPRLKHLLRLYTYG